MRLLAASSELIFRLLMKISGKSQEFELKV